MYVYNIYVEREREEDLQSRERHNEELISERVYVCVYIYIYIYIEGERERERERERRLTK